ncbi:respiratory burst oxidase-like protein [Fragilaria crotonensis]|nr:respiratory burst oxidase-like protein [Fragilaria crotonensis]
MVNERDGGAKVTTMEVVDSQGSSAKKDAAGTLLVQPPTSANLESSVHSSMREFKLHGKQAAIDRAFEELDVTKDGRLDRQDITCFMREAAKVIKLDVPDTVISDAVDALMEDVGASLTQYISKEQFDHLFERHPDLLKCFDDEVSVAVMKKRISSRKLTWEEVEEQERENLEVWESMHARWKSEKVHIVWTCLYVAANIIAFTYQGISYFHRDETLNVFGSCIIVARGSAQCLNLNCCLILLPVCRHFLTRLRATRLRFFFPFDTLLESHIYFGIAILLFTTLHVSAHVCDFYRFARADETDIVALFGDKLGEIPDGIQERWTLMLGTTAGITGIIMLVCLLVAYPCTLWRQKKFNSFWYTHHLLIVMLIALCFHGTGNLLEPFQSVYWITVPFALYIVPRVLRETPLTKCKVLDIAMKKGNVVGIKLQRPKYWDNAVHAGMYGFIQVTKVSRLEWHPFTLTSAPCEDFIEFHFARVGDWTAKVHNLLEDLVSPKADEEGADQNMATTTTTPEAPVSTPPNVVIKVEGPIGASSQGFTDFPILVLVGAGIGVTPMISVLKQLLVNPGKMKRVFLYWTVRDRSAFEWFASLMDDIFDSDQKNVIQVRHFLTSMKEDDRDIGAVLLHHATRARHRKSNFDLILGQYNHRQVEVGRPNWEDELKSVKVDAKELGHTKCGVFLCGPKVMAVDVASTCFALSKKDPRFHFYFTKETF